MVFKMERKEKNLELASSRVPRRGDPAALLGLAGFIP